MRFLICAALMAGSLLGQVWSPVPLSMLEVSPWVYTPPRMLFAGTWSPNEGILMHGGAGRGPILSDWHVVRDGIIRESPLSLTPGLPRFGHAMAWWGNGPAAVMFGGEGAASSLLNETVIRGINIQSTYSGPSPSARSRHAMSSIPSTGQVLLFGGRDATGPLGDTWVFNGVWSQVQPASATPPPSVGHALAPALIPGNVLLVCPGVNGAETWRWDGTSWTQLLPALSPPNSAHYTMALDPVRNRIVLFIASVFTFANPSTMEWDGQNWTDVTPANSLMGPRAFGTMVFDEDALAVTLVGGQSYVPPGFPAVPGVFADINRWRGAAGLGQENISYSGMDVNALVGIAPLKGPWDCRVRSSGFALTFWGSAYASYVLGLGPELDPGVSTGPAGILNLGTPPMFQDIQIIADGTASPFFNLGPTGISRLFLSLPPMPPGTPLGSIQGYILDTSSSPLSPPVLTTAFNLVTY